MRTTTTTKTTITSLTAIVGTSECITTILSISHMLIRTTDAIISMTRTFTVPITTIPTITDRACISASRLDVHTGIHGTITITDTTDIITPGTMAATDMATTIIHTTITTNRIET